MCRLQSVTQAKHHRSLVRGKVAGSLSVGWGGNISTLYDQNDKKKNLYDSSLEYYKESQMAMN